MSANAAGLDALRLNGLAFLLLLLVLPLTSVGATAGIDPLWWLGLAFLVIGAATTLVTEFVLDGSR